MVHGVNHGLMVHWVKRGPDDARGKHGLNGALGKQPYGALVKHAYGALGSVA